MINPVIMRDGELARPNLAGMPLDLDLCDDRSHGIRAPRIDDLVPVNVSPVRASHRGATLAAFLIPSVKCLTRLGRFLNDAAERGRMARICGRCRLLR
jgi:hypothetical protein